MKKLMKNVAVLALAAAVAVGSVTGVSAAVKSPTSSLVPVNAKNVAVSNGNTVDTKAKDVYKRQSLVLTSSSTFTLDVIVPVSKKKMNEMKQVVIMRIFIVFFIVVSAVIAIFKDSHPEVTFIAQMMGVSWGALAGAFLAPFLYGLYWKGVTKVATVVCFVWGCAVARCV